MKHAYIVVHLYGPDSALLWSPEVMDRKYIRRPGTKLGEWFEVDEEKSTLIECAPFCETRIRNMRLEVGFNESIFSIRFCWSIVFKVKTPITFFNDAKFRDVVGFVFLT